MRSSRICFSSEAIRAFADWSHDHNPIHVDPEFAGGTVFGQQIVHRMLSVVGAAAELPSEPVRRLDIEFRDVVSLNREFALDSNATQGGAALQVSLIDGRSDVLVMRADSRGDARAPVGIEALPAGGVRSEPIERDVREFVPGTEFTGVYPIGRPPESFRGGLLTDVQCQVLALCSYVIGMEMPGLRSLFTRAVVEFGEFGDNDLAVEALHYRVTVTGYQSAFRILNLNVDVFTPSGDFVATAELTAYVRFSPMITDVGLLKERHEADGLQGKVALVCGGSRGLGADISAALATAGAEVYASYRSDRGSAERLEQALEEHNLGIRFLQGDAGDPRWCEEAVNEIVRQHGRLDLLVLNACETARAIPLSADSCEEINGYLQRNLRSVTMPLGMALKQLAASGGTVVGISSSYVNEAPPHFAHYVGLKKAAEAAVIEACGNASIAGLIVRPGPLLTRWNDTPTQILTAIPADWVATRIVKKLAETNASGGPVASVILEEFPEPERQAAAAADDRDETDGVDDAEPAFTIAVASTFTDQPIGPSLNLWLAELGIEGKARFAPYNQIIQELVNPASLTGSVADGASLLLVRVQDWIRELGDDRTAAELRQYLAETASEYTRALRTFRARATQATIATHVLVCPSSSTGSPETDAIVRQAEQDWTADIQGISGVTVTVAESWHGTYRVAADHVFDANRDAIGHIPFTDDYYHVLGTIAARMLHRRRQARKKVVVVDCDNTLWAGVVGEVGAEGVEFHSQHLALQRRLCELADNGVLICLASKNEDFDVWDVFEKREEMPLQRSHIAGAMINWNPKSGNVESLASQLNLGLDSFVFIDDNPVECGEMRTRIPEVLTLQWPPAADEALALLAHCWELDVVEGTAEDKRRTQLYKEEFKRQELAETLQYDEFLASLELVVDVQPLTDEDLKRASQLTLRTNQFNFTTIRREEHEVDALRSDGEHRVFTVRVRDRFGDYGLVGLVIAKLQQQQQQLEIDTFLLSCRVLGRGVEHQMIRQLGQLALDEGLSRVVIQVEKTRRNAPARTFAASLAPAGLEIDAGDSFRFERSAEELAQLEFQPQQASSATSSSSTKSAAAAEAVSSMRTREAQIVRAASLGTIGLLAEEISGAPTVSSQTSAADVEEIVAATFANKLNTSVAEVRSVDRMDALSCTSFKIVEITVALLDHFPQLPKTLLFEHQTVSSVVEHIESLTTGDTVAPLPGRQESGRAPEKSDAGDVAVVGMSVRCPGVSSPSELFELLSNKDSSVAPVADRPEFFGDVPTDRTYWASLLEDAGEFDAELFGVSPREAELMDPQLRLVLQAAWAALEDAGDGGPRHDTETGVFIGVMYSDYVFRANQYAHLTDSPYRSWESFSLANKLSHLLDLHGPSFAVDTACSSSGTAIHLACQALIDGECTTAIAGGVNLLLDPTRLAQLARLGILSPDGHCEPFGNHTNGTVMGEGVGIVVLRRLDEAIERGDQILGVIKGTGLSTGSGAVGFTAPNPQTQAAAIQRCVEVAGIDPRTISYVETHGTGTSLGDPIEVRGLSLAYQNQRLWFDNVRVAPDCRLGSIKPNVGHLEAGSGVLGLIKVLLQLQHKVLLPSITSTEPNEQIAFDDLPFSVQATLEPWEPPTAIDDGQTKPLPRRAGLSSFGVGGANAHVIVEEAPEDAAVHGNANAEEKMHADSTSASERPAWRMLAISARSPAALAQRAGALHELLIGGHCSGEDLTLTANTGWKQLQHRRGLAWRNQDELVERLHQCRELAQPSAASSTSLAMLFSGQGAQYPQMGQLLYAVNDVFRATMDQCAELLQDELDRPLLELLQLDAGDDHPIHQTGYTQPALFAIEYSLAKLWEHWGLRPSLLLGHSIGEHVAMCVAGGVSLGEGLRLIAARGRLMQQLPAGGAMWSIMAPEQDVAPQVEPRQDQVSIAAVNGPAQTVISGDADVAAALAAEFEQAGVRVKQLRVSHAFHSPQMDPMLAEYAEVVRSIRFEMPKIPIISSVLGRQAAEELLTPEYWVQQVRHSVRFYDALVAATQQANVFVEAGPHPVLATLGRMGISDEGLLWVPSLARDKDDEATIFQSIGQLYERGWNFDWEAVNPMPRAQRISLPSYPFQTKRYWLKSEFTQGPSAAPQGENEVESAGYVVHWTPEPRPQPARATGRWLVVGPDADTCAPFVQNLEAAGANVSCLLQGEQADAESWADRLQPLSDDLVGVVALTPEGSNLGSDSANDSGRLDGVWQSQELLRAIAQATSAKVWFATRGAVATHHDEVSVDPGGGALWGWARTAAAEMADHWGGVVDLDPALPVTDGACCLIEEILCGADDWQTAFREGVRLVPRLEMAGKLRARRAQSSTGWKPIPRRAQRAQTSGRAQSSTGWKPIPRRAQSTIGGVHLDGAWVITGGLGALGQQVTAWLAAQGASQVVLLTRGESDSPRALRAVSELSTDRCRVEVRTCDVTQQDALGAVLADVSQLTGIVHAAGMDRENAIHSMSREEWDEIVEAKVAGAMHLDQLTRTGELEPKLKHFVCFSSMASLTGSRGHSHYCAANACLDALCASRRASGLPGQAINWGPWRGGGMADSDALRQFEKVGNLGLEPDDAMDWLGVVLAEGVGQTMVARVDWSRFRPIVESRRPQPFYGELGRSNDSTTTNSTAATAAAAAQPAWVAIVLDAEPAARQQTLARLLRTAAAETLGYQDDDQLSDDQTFADLGMDSVLIVDFVRRLERNLSFSVMSQVAAHPTVQALAAELIPEIQSRAASVESVASVESAPVGDAPWLAAVADLPPQDVRATLGQFVREAAARALGHASPESIPTDANFADLGMDSVLSVEFARAIDAGMGGGAAPAVFQHPTAAALAEHLGEQVLSSAPAASTSSTISTISTISTDDGIATWPIDTAELMDFCSASWPHRAAELQEPRWRWMFQQSAERLGESPRVWLFRGNRRIGGHTAAIPVELHVAGDTLRTGWHVETMVDPQFRTQAVGAQLMHRATMDMPFSLSLGQTEEARRLIVGLGWEVIAPLQMSQLLLKPAKVLDGKLPSALTPAAAFGLQAYQSARRALRGKLTLTRRHVERFAEPHDQLWERAAPDIGCGVVRDASYLNWKYVDQPGQEFLRFELLSAGHEVVAVGVLMFREPDEAYRYRRAFLVDLVAPLSDSSLLCELLTQAADAAKERADSLTCMYINPQLGAALSRCGFLTKEPQRYLVAKVDTLPAEQSQVLRSPERWFVTQGDSDIDRPW